MPELSCKYALMNNRLSVYIPKNRTDRKILDRLSDLASKTERSRNSHAVEALLDHIETHSALSQEVSDRLGQLDNRTKEHLDLATSAWDAYHGLVYEMDLLVMAVLNRSLSNLRGFSSQLHQLNFMSGAILLRSQIDNGLRLSAAWMVWDPKKFVRDILSGVPIRQLKDRDGNKLTDAFLCGVLSKDHPWIRRVYENTCGYVHLSEKHLLQAHRPTEQFKMETTVGERDAFVTDSLRLDAIEAFDAATELLFHFVRGWIYTKKNPEDPVVLETRRKIMEEHGQSEEADVGQQ